MKKNFRVTVNGKDYEVEVEEIKEGVVREQHLPKVETVAEVIKEEKKEEVVVQAPATSGSIKINSPMPGNIWKIIAKNGDKVEKNQVILILEAMKMENEIVAPEAGTIANILVKEGDKKPIIMNVAEGTMELKINSFI